MTLYDSAVIKASFKVAYMAKYLLLQQLVVNAGQSDSVAITLLWYTKDI
jgi:hypothetical protein